MGYEKMKNLSDENILLDYGIIDYSVITELEINQNIILQQDYVDFITKHNGASMFKDYFDYYSPEFAKKISGSIAFIKAEKINDTICSLMEQTTEDENNPDIWKFLSFFSKWLIPFGDNGGGDLICFDYRSDHTTNNPPIVIWNHYLEFKYRTVFIANNFEEFINMLHLPPD